MSAEGKSREPAFDYLRVIAVFSVMIIHVCAMEWKVLDIHSGQWLVLHVYDIIAKFSVPMFFMISGRFFLDPSKKVSASGMLKRCFHIILVFAFWSMIYMFLNIIRVISEGGGLKENLNWIIVEFFSGEYHMWFLYAIFGLYLVTPLLRRLTEDKILTEYFLVLFLIFGLIWPMAERMPKIGILFVHAGEAMAFRMTIGYAGYYVLGYYLYKYPMTKRKAKILYISGAIGLIFSVTATLFVSWETGIANEDMAVYLSLNVALVTSAVYGAFLKYFSKKKITKLISTVSQYSFGCYLIHPLFLWIFEWIGFVPSAFWTGVSVPLISVIAMFLSLFLTWLFHRTSVLKEVI